MPRLAGGARGGGGGTGVAAESRARSSEVDSADDMSMRAVPCSASATVCTSIPSSSSVVRPLEGTGGGASSVPAEAATTGGREEVRSSSISMSTCALGT